MTRVGGLVTVTEMALLQGWHKHELPESGLSERQLAGLIGNGMSLNVLEAVLRSIMPAVGLAPD